MKFIAMLALTAAVSMPAFAGGFYAGGDLGRTKIEVDASNGTTASANTTSGSIFGGYQFNRYVGVEIGVRALGKETFMGDTVHASAVQASLMAWLPLSNDFDLFGRVGVARLELSDDNYNSRQSKTKAVYGLGARYAVTQGLGIRGEYDQYDKWDGVTFSVWSLGADYRF
ncbi:MAG: porin family protein [Burkholderiales bacterium]|nr:porin family protein [Burkholderiales bacterium]